MLAWLKPKRQESYQTVFTKNGGLLLEELITIFNGRSNPIRHFSAKELLEATNNYDGCQVFAEYDAYLLYQGFLKERPVIVKKYNAPNIWGDLAVTPYKNIAIGSQMSVHKNVLKVLGCCLETQEPTIVYEFVGSTILSTCISATNVEPLPWRCRLKIARDLASAVAYLHTAFSRPIVHRDIKSSNVILDENNVPKLMEFGLCISIPEGQSRVKDDVRGKIEYIAPEYFRTCYVTEKADVYSFGVLLLELLSAIRPVDLFTNPSRIRENGKPCVQKLDSVVDCRITDEGIEQEQLLDFKELIVKCISEDKETRPTMIEVAKELGQIYQSFQSPH